MGSSVDRTAEGPVAATTEQMRALSHPTRVRIWTELGSADRTVSQLARRLTLNKGSVSHHLAILVKADVARRSTDRTVRGGTERYYTRVADRLTFPHQRGTDTASHAMMVEVLRGVDADTAPRVHQRNVRLNPAQAAGLADHLDRLLHDLEPADERHPQYGVVTAIYRRGGGA